MIICFRLSVLYSSVALGKVSFEWWSFEGSPKVSDIVFTLVKSTLSELAHVSDLYLLFINNSLSYWQLVSDYCVILVNNSKFQ